MSGFSSKSMHTYLSLISYQVTTAIILLLMLIISAWYVSSLYKLFYLYVNT